MTGIKHLLIMLGDCMGTVRKLQKLSLPPYRSYIATRVLFGLVLVVCVGSLIFISSSSRPLSTKKIDPREVPRIRCSIRGDKWIVVTSMCYPTPAIYKFLSLKTPWNVIVIGVRKTPPDWLTHRPINTSRLLFLSMDDQRLLNLRILQHLPEGSYARKNIGYLVAIACGARTIFESDDDNILDGDDIPVLPKEAQTRDIPWIAFRRQRSPFINICGSFGHPKVWPRGFPTAELKNVTEDGWHSVRRNEGNPTYAYVQQYLADIDPDADAIYRLAHSSSVGRIKFDREQPSIAIDLFTFSPYTTQNTVTHYEAFWGLYLPITNTFRVCDIWRGFWVQRLLWDIGGRLVFGTAPRRQGRSNHSFIADVKDDHQLYHRSASFAQFLTAWSSLLPSLVSRISQLMTDLVRAKFFNAKEVEIMDAWLADLQFVNYSFPAVVKPPSSRTIIKRRAAVCVTGVAECIQEGWSITHREIQQHIQGSADAFLFLSSISVRNPVSLYDRLKQARSYPNSTVIILYQDREIDPKVNKTCRTYFNPTLRRLQQIPYYQQMWSLSACFDLVKDYEKMMNIRYDLLIRARPDTLLMTNGSALRSANTSAILIPDENHYGGYNDRLAVGSMASMERYMRRWHDLKDCYVKNIHAEHFLRSTLERFNISVHLTKDLALKQMPHGPDQCH